MIWRRFDEIVHFPLPSTGERQRYLRWLLNGVPFTGSFGDTALLLDAMSFAEIKRVVLEAVKTMVLHGKQSLHQTDIEENVISFKEDLAAAKRETRKPVVRGTRK